MYVGRNQMLAKKMDDKYYSIIPRNDLISRVNNIIPKFLVNSR